MRRVEVHERFGDIVVKNVFVRVLQVVSNGMSWRVGELARPRFLEEVKQKLGQKK